MNILYKIINKTTKGPYWVMYDNECSFCCKIMRSIHCLDLFSKIQWVDKDWGGDFPARGHLKISDTIVVFNPKGEKLYYKIDGVFRVLMCIPFGFCVAWILKIPILSIFFDYGYDWISRSRNCSV